MDLPSTFQLKVFTIQKRRNAEGKVIGDEVTLFLEFHKDVIKATNLFDLTGVTSPHDHIAQLGL